MKAISFNKLSSEAQINAIEKIYQLSKDSSNKIGNYDSVDEVAQDIQNGFSPDEWFSFEVDEDTDEVNVEIL